VLYEAVAEAYRDLEAASGRLALIDRMAEVIPATPRGAGEQGAEHDRPAAPSSRRTSVTSPHHGGLSVPASALKVASSSARVGREAGDGSRQASRAPASGRGIRRRVPARGARVVS
jgi:hypothetical protein